MRLKVSQAFANINKLWGWGKVQSSYCCLSISSAARVKTREHERVRTKPSGNPSQPTPALRVLQRHKAGATAMPLYPRGADGSDRRGFSIVAGTPAFPIKGTILPSP
ncbi:3-oxoacyl-ACP synthase [Platysternon megacephalum]|uniref:3-oxoacyl-ACP synthase n=1 Tax=Platysternon megacephalum TaxID=55544 RepID=A0A4D9DC82_9SAUR|nr:3-oxoacyl-ACP synthase [Platysternon megacephalum]